MTRRFVFVGFGTLLCFVALGCASNDNPMDGGHREGGVGDAGDGATEGGSGDSGPDTGVDMMVMGTANTCETCTTDADCIAGYCANLVSGGKACLPGCDRDLPMCPRMFTCIYDASGTGVATTICAPVGGPCCVDEDGDGYGVGVGCMGPDCNDMDPMVHPGINEVCDGIDTNCNHMVDEMPNDCMTGRCTPQPDGTYSSITDGVCSSASCTAGTMTSCALYTCHDGGSMGSTCATMCAPAGTDDDNFCIASAHCDSAACASDQPNSGACNEDSDCQSSHCDNGFCCGTGTCCSTTTDCPGGGGVSIVCEDPSTCQGARGMVTCSAANQCLTMSGIPDDTACDAMTLARDCGLYLPVYCDGTTDQPMTPRTCRSSCTSDADCVTAAHCTVGICIPDLPPGGPCGRTSDCVAGLSCVDSTCCTTSCTGACEACNLAGSMGTCTNITRGSDPSGECAGFSCSGYYGGFDATTPNICFRRADVSDSQSACDGAGACITPDVACPAQPNGLPEAMCMAPCAAAAPGTCTGTTAGICNNLDDPTMRTTCGIGPCTNSVQMCLGGVPQMCTPLPGSPEACDGVDNDCNGTPDDGPLSVMCPPGTGVSVTQCSSGMCSIMTCMPGYLDLNATYTDGCECNVGTMYTSCASAFSLGSIPTGGSASAMGNVPPGGSRWYTVSFPHSGRPGGGTPHITLTPSTDFTMSITYTCGGSGVPCATESGTSTATTAFDFIDNVSMPGPNQWNMNPTMWPDTVFIGVTRNTPATDCPSTVFTVTVTR